MELPRTVALCSFRLGGSDGVAIESAKWAGALAALGCAVTTVAGEGHADVVLPGLAAGSAVPPTTDELRNAFAGADLVIVENLCSLPLNPGATRAVARVLRGRPALLHHHDIASQRRALAHLGPPPDDPAWLHVCVNQRTTAELMAHGYAATTSYNTFDPAPPAGRRATTRARAGVGPGDRLVLQPTRAIARKAIATGLALAEQLRATYWLLGPAEDGYGPECDRILAASAVPVVRGTAPARRGAETADAYAACDVVVLPSTWEGFGNPAIESATHRRPLAIGPYPVASELRRFGFAWFDARDPGVLSAWMDEPDERIIERNAALARRYFSLTELPARLERLIRRLGGAGAVPSLPGTLDGQ